MKKTLYLLTCLLVCLFFISCGGGGGDNSPVYSDPDPAPIPEPVPPEPDPVPPEPIPPEPVPPEPEPLTQADLNGEYQLLAYQIYTYNQEGDIINLKTQDDAITWYGEMTIWPSGSFHMSRRIDTITWAFGDLILEVEDTQLLMRNGGENYWMEIIYNQDKEELKMIVPGGPSISEDNKELVLYWIKL